MLQRRRRSREVLSATCTKRKRDRCQTVRRASVDLFQRHELKLRPRCECFASHDACFAAERSSSCKHPLQSESLFCSAALGIYKTTSFRPSQTGLRIVFARALALPGNLFSLQNCARAGHDVSIQKKLQLQGDALSKHDCLPLFPENQPSNGHSRSVSTHCAPIYGCRAVCLDLAPRPRDDGSA